MFTEKGSNHATTRILKQVKHYQLFLLNRPYSHILRSTRHMCMVWTMRRIRRMESH